MMSIDEQNDKMTEATPMLIDSCRKTPQQDGLRSRKLLNFNTSTKDNESVNQHMEDDYNLVYLREVLGDCGSKFSPMSFTKSHQKKNTSQIS